MRTHPMNIAFKYAISIILIFLYLLFPVANLVHAGTVEASCSLVQAAGTTNTSPCNDCPCTNDQSSDCCDTASCNCECHAPFVFQRFLLNYTPVVVSHSYSEPGWALPQVDLAIFVPPQNLS